MRAQGDNRSPIATTPSGKISSGSQSSHLCTSTVPTDRVFASHLLATITSFAQTSHSERFGETKSCLHLRDLSYLMPLMRYSAHHQATIKLNRAFRKAL